MPRKFLVLLLPSLFLMWLPGPAYAQGPDSEAAFIDWQELKTEKFIIVYADSVFGVANFDCACGIEEAQRYAAEHHSLANIDTLVDLMNGF